MGSTAKPRARLDSGVPPVHVADIAVPLSPAKEVGECEVRATNREIGTNRNCPSQLILRRFRLVPFPPVHPSYLGDSPTPFAEERGLAFATAQVGRGSMASFVRACGAKPLAGIDPGGITELSQGVAPATPGKVCPPSRPRRWSYTAEDSVGRKVDRSDKAVRNRRAEGRPSFLQPLRGWVSSCSCTQGSRPGLCSCRPFGAGIGLSLSSEGWPAGTNHPATTETISKAGGFLNPPFNRANDEVALLRLGLGLPLTLPSPHRQHEHLAMGRGFPEGFAIVPTGFVGFPLWIASRGVLA